MNYLNHSEQSVSLNTLPDIGNRLGWPWQQEVASLSTAASFYPKISIITPSFNQGKYLEETIRSIILQNYPNYELIIIDAGSTDETLEVIAKYERWITYWVSEKDRGQSHAILKGLDQVTGHIVNWINSDDICAPNAFYEIARQFDLDKFDVLCGRCHFIEGNISNIGLRDERMGLSKDIGTTLLVRNINQPSAFFKADVMKKLKVDEQFHYAMDLDMWFRYLLLNGQSRVKLVDSLLTYFRLHGASKSVAEANKFQNDINKVYYNILLGARQPELLMSFAQSIIYDFDKFIPEPYSINIPIEELCPFFADYSLRSAQYYYEIGQYASSRIMLGLVDDYDVSYRKKDSYISLKQKLTFPDFIINSLRKVKNIM